MIELKLFYVATARRHATVQTPPLGAEGGYMGLPYFREVTH
jgi:hypothetical protein